MPSSAARVWRSATGWPGRSTRWRRLRPSRWSVSMRPIRPRSYLAARARVRDFAHTDLETALYERRSVRAHARHAAHDVRRPGRPRRGHGRGLYESARARQRRRLIAMLEEQGVARDGARWLRRVERDTMAALHERGEATAAELTESVPALGKKLSFGEGKTWGAQVGVSTRVLFLLGDRRRGSSAAARADPGSRASTGGRRPTRGSGRRWQTVDHGAAAAELLRRWLRAFGPAYGHGHPLVDRLDGAPGQRRARGPRRRRGRLDGGRHRLRAGRRRAAAARAPKPWVAFLPSLDPTVMGWKERDWYLGDHGAALFDRNGNAGPTIWADGRVIGGWVQTDGRRDRDQAARAGGPCDERARRA